MNVRRIYEGECGRRGKCWAFPPITNKRKKETKKRGKNKTSCRHYQHMSWMLFFSESKHKGEQSKKTSFSFRSSKRKKQTLFVASFRFFLSHLQQKIYIHLTIHTYICMTFHLHAVHSLAVSSWSWWKGKLRLLTLAPPPSSSSSSSSATSGAICELWSQDPSSESKEVGLGLWCRRRLLFLVLVLLLLW